MASLREWTALSLSALLFSVVAGYGVGRALNAKNEPPALRPAQSAVAIVDRTGEPAAAIGSLSADEMVLPSVVAKADPEETPARTSAETLAPPPPAPPPPAPPPSPAIAVATAAPSAAPLPIQAGERASLVISFADQRLYVMAGERVLGGYRVKFGFDPAKVKPGETRISAKSAGAKQIDLGWKGYPIVGAGERGFILSPGDFEMIVSRLPVGATVSTTRDRIGAAAPASAGSTSAHSASGAHVTPASTPQQQEEPKVTPMPEPAANDAAQPAFLAAAPKPR
jgi:hypothetical protein